MPGLIVRQSLWKPGSPACQYCVHSRPVLWFTSAKEKTPSCCRSVQADALHAADPHPPTVHHIDNHCPLSGRGKPSEIASKHLIPPHTALRTAGPYHPQSSDPERRHAALSHETDALYTSKCVKGKPLQASSCLCLKQHKRHFVIPPRSRPAVAESPLTCVVVPPLSRALQFWSHRRMQTVKKCSLWCSEEMEYDKDW